MFNRFLALLLFCIAMPAMAADTNTPFYQALRNGGDSSPTIHVEVNKGQAVHLSAPAASVAVANPAIADVQVVSPRLLFVNGVAPGETSIIAVDANDNVVLQGSVQVSHNLSGFAAAVKQVSPDADVTASSADNAIILNGKVDSPVVSEKVQKLAAGFLQGDKQQVVNLIDTSGGDQVMLKVRIVELARSELKRFGINWESLINTGAFAFGVGQGRDFIGNTLNAAGQPNAYDRDSTNGTNSLFASYHGGGQNINAAIDALEDDGLVSILAEPNLTTRSGQQASFLAGGEIPIPVPGQDGTVTIQYRQFGVSLQFTPIVLSKDKISLSVLPEVSALSDANAITGGSFGTIPSITTRRANTTVDLGSGQTFAIAGLLRNDQNNSIDKFPFLGDLPILGPLFRSSSYQNNQTELVILVTPYIAKPVDNPDALATPLDGFKPATDYERIVLGQLHGESEKYDDSEARPAKTPASVFQGIGGQAGFLMR